VGDSRETRRLPKNGGSLVTCFVDAPSSHADCDDWEGDTFEDEEGLKFARVNESHRELDEPEEYEAEHRGGGRSRGFG